MVEAVPALADGSATEATASAYREHADAVWGLLGRLGVAAEDREDALQEVFLVVHRGWSRFERRSAIGTWIHGIAVRVAITHRRRRGVGHRRTAMLDDDVAASDPDPHDRLEHLDAARVLDGLLDELDDDKRTMFVLSDVQGLPVPAVAEMLALNVRTAYSRLRVARADFERALQRWQARRAHVESPPPGLAQLRRRAHAPAPRRAWIAIAAAIEGGRAGAITGAFGLAGAHWAGIAALATVIGVGAAVVDGMSSGDRDSTATPIAVAPAHDDGRESSPIATRPGAPLVEDAALAPAPEPAPVPATGSTTPIRAESRARAPAGSIPAAAAAEDTTAAEVGLLRRARAALRGNRAADALALLDEHARRAEGDRFAEERGLLRIETLCRLGRRDDARTEARAWARPAGPSVDDLLAQRCDSPNR